MNNISCFPQVARLLAGIVGVEVEQQLSGAGSFCDQVGDAPRCVDVSPLTRSQMHALSPHLECTWREAILSFLVEGGRFAV
jgi:hypothetical protein